MLQQPRLRNIQKELLFIFDFENEFEAGEIDEFRFDDNSWLLPNITSSFLTELYLQCKFIISS